MAKKPAGKADARRKLSALEKVAAFTEATRLDSVHAVVPAPEAAVPAALAGRRVLLVEDNELNQIVATDLLARWVGVGRGVDTAMYLGFLMIFYLVFRAFGKLEDLDRQLTRIVRANAIKDAEAQLTASDPGKPSS